MRIKKFVLALAVGATATTAWADSPYGYGSSGARAAAAGNLVHLEHRRSIAGSGQHQLQFADGIELGSVESTRFDRAARPEPTEPKRSAAGIDRAGAGLSHRSRRRIALGMRLRR